MFRALRLLGITVLASCGGGYSRLDVDKVQSVAVSIDDPQGFCAYGAVALRALVTYKDGKQVASQMPGENEDGKLRPTEFQWSASQGSVDELAVLRLAPDPLRWFDEPIEVNARVAARAELGGVTSLTPRFDCGGTVDLRGAPGARGGELEDGGPGGPGPSVDVALAYMTSKRSGRLVLVRVQRDEQPAEYFVIDADQALEPFVLDAQGGKGGRGGQGFSGVDGFPGIPGAPGVDGTTCESTSAGGPGSEGGPGSPGGPGRNGGPGGAGGQVTLRYDERFPELARLVEVRTGGGASGEEGPGGSGGRGGKGGAGGQGGKLPVGCPGSTAAAGNNGPDGPAGPDGMTGVRGVEGPPGELREAAAEVTALFADEIARGVPVETRGAP